MIQDIDKHIALINESLAWAKEYRKDSFPAEQFREWRRKLAKIRKALTGNCSAAAYGESQVGKSYLMSSLLSSAQHPFVIASDGREYSFIDDLNPSGGENSKTESTGVITRFTIRHEDAKVKDCIKIQNLSVVDIILLLADSYYNDIKIDPETILPHDVINKSLEELSHLWRAKTVQHDIITEDDIKDINDYIKDVIGNGASAIYQSNFCKVIAPVIQYIPYDKWIDVFSLLWNRNQELNRLFVTLVNAYKKIEFQQEVYVPFRTVLRSKGTLLKIEWLDTVCGVQIDTGNDEIYTDVYDKNGHLIASGFNKGELSALIAELTFELPNALADDRKFLHDMDLLDFPGARSREKYREKEIATVLPKMLRRGKVAYLFNKYSRSLQISSVLFCHHNDQKTEPSIGEAINGWIEENVGKNPEERATLLNDTHGIAPLFFVATKFNIDLERTKTNDPGTSLDSHWKRFDTVVPEIIKPNRWLDEWAKTHSGKVAPFQNIYPLRDFYWSRENKLFDGYRDRGSQKSPETAVHIHADFPDYLDRLRESFLSHKFVRRHFADPEQTWDDVATLNNDGSKAIIRNLDAIATVLDQARRKKYLSELENLKQEIIDALMVFYEPEDAEAKNRKVQLIARDIRCSLSQTVATDQAAFGRIIDRLMISPEALRNIAYDIIICHSDTPKDFSAVKFIRAMSGVDITASRAINIDRLMTYYMMPSEDELVAQLKSQHLELEDVIATPMQTLSSLSGVITKHIVDHWVNHLNQTAQEQSKILPHADEIVFMLVSLFERLGVRDVISDKIGRYTEVFDPYEQPNAIGDFASLTLNNFVSTAGRCYMKDEDMEELRRKADDCGLQIDTTPSGWEEQRWPQPLIETLRAFDEAAALINQEHIDLQQLQRLPFWNNYRRWENFVFIGLLYSSDISHCDPECNAKVKALMDRASALYSA